MPWAGNTALHPHMHAMSRRRASALDRFILDSLHFLRGPVKGWGHDAMCWPMAVHGPWLCMAHGCAWPMAVYGPWLCMDHSSHLDYSTVLDRRMQVYRCDLTVVTASFSAMNRKFNRETLTRAANACPCLSQVHSMILQMCQWHESVHEYTYVKKPE